MFNKKTVKDVDLVGKVVLLRDDYNVPISYSDNGECHILNDYRIKASLPTIKYLLDNGVRKIIIISHLGRPNSVESLADLDELEKLPNGKRKFSLRPIFSQLQKLLAAEFRSDLNSFKLNFPMNFHTTPIFSRTHYSVPIAEADDDYKIEMLENLRFSRDEKANNSDYAKTLLEITGADIFVQDGFGVVHRAHSSTDAIAHIIPSYAGLLLEKEATTILRIIQNPPRPFVAILAGAKISDKLPLIEKIIDCADKILIGGAIANTFLQTKGFEIGLSKTEPGQEDTVRAIFDRARRKVGSENLGDFLVLPVDFQVLTSGLDKKVSKEIGDISPEDKILDIGEKSIRRIENELRGARTIIWNGTVGLAENPLFSFGSLRVASAISLATQLGAISLVGGGDTSAFILENFSNDTNNFSLISTGGGATLELMSGNTLPGIEVLPNK